VLNLSDVIFIRWAPPYVSLKFLYAFVLTGTIVALRRHLFNNERNVFFYLSLVTGISGRPKPEIRFLSG